MKRALAISVIDQGVLSAQSLLVTFVLIRFGDGEAVGRFALAMAIYFVLLAIQDALAGAVLSVRVFARPPEEQRDMIGLISTVAMVVLMGGAIIVSLGGAAWLRFDLDLTLAMLGTVVTGLYRELSRTVLIVTDRMHRCLTVDGLAAAGSVALLPVMWQFNEPEAACLWSIAIAHGGATLIFGPKLHVSLRRTPEALRRYRTLFKLTRWNLVSGIANEVQSRTFLFLVEAFRGLVATATLHAGRLIISPIILLMMAIGRIVLPRMAHHIYHGRLSEAYSIIRLTAAGLFALALAYCLVMLPALPLLERYLFRGQYPEIVQTMYAWGAYSVLSVPIWCLTWLYRAMERFRELAIVNVLDAIFVLLAMCSLLLPVPLYASVGAMIFSDLIVGFVLIRMLNDPRALERIAA